MATYVNDLRLKEISTGDESGTWGTSTNTNLELIAEAFSFGTEAITTNADTHTTTIADGSTDPGRSLFLKYTGTLDSACTITIGPNTVSKLWLIENATSGSQSIIIKQGSGATVTIANGSTKAIYSDGAGAGGAMVDAFVDLDLTGTTTVAALTASGASTLSGGATINTDLRVPVGTTGERPSAAAGQFRYNSTTGKFEGYTDSWGDIGGGEAQFTLDTMTGDGSDTTLTMSVTPASENSIQVYFDGVYQHKDTFSFSGTTLTFSTAPATGVKVEVVIISTVAASTTPGDGTVTTAKLASDAVTQAKIADDAVGADQLAASAVVTASIVDDAVTAAKLASNAVVTASVVDDAITSAKIADNAVDIARLNVSDGTAGQSLTTNGSGTLAFATIGGAYNDFAIKTGNYTAVSKDQLIVNSGSAVTITLPASPSAGDVVFIKNAGTGTVTVARNGSKINSTADDGELAADAGASLVYVDATIGWEEL